MRTLSPATAPARQSIEFSCTDARRATAKCDSRQLSADVVCGAKLARPFGTAPQQWSNRVVSSDAECVPAYDSHRSYRTAPCFLDKNTGAAPELAASRPVSCEGFSQGSNAAKFIADLYCMPADRMLRFISSTDPAADLELKQSLAERAARMRSWRVSGGISRIKIRRRCPFRDFAVIAGREAQ